MSSRGGLVPHVIALVAVAALACPMPGTIARGERLPLIDGAFWQPNDAAFLGLTNEQLADEVSHFKSLGMDLIIFQYGGRFDEQLGGYRGYMLSDVLPPVEGYEDGPIEAMIEAAEREGVDVILGGLLMPRPRGQRWQDALDAWLSEEAMAYRREVIERWADHDAVVGFYTPNEYNPAEVAEHGADPQELIEATQEVLALVREHAPHWEIVHSIGLYLEIENDQYRTVRRETLDSFWRPWVAQLDAVDTWMIIDGVGTTLSNHEHTDMAQAWAAELAAEHGKTYWTDVENAYMTSDRMEPFTIDELAASLEIAARHAEQIVTFDYIHYMARNVDRPAANALHEDYARYRRRVLAEQADPDGDTDGR